MSQSARIYPCQRQSGHRRMYPGPNWRQWPARSNPRRVSFWSFSHDRRRSRAVRQRVSERLPIFIFGRPIRSVIAGFQFGFIKDLLLIGVLLQFDRAADGLTNGGKCEVGLRPTTCRLPLYSAFVLPQGKTGRAISLDMLARWAYAFAWLPRPSEKEPAFLACVNPLVGGARNEPAYCSTKQHGTSR